MRRVCECATRKGKILYFTIRINKFSFFCIVFSAVDSLAFVEDPPAMPGQFRLSPFTHSSYYLLKDETLYFTAFALLLLVVLHNPYNTFFLKICGRLSPLTHFLLFVEDERNIILLPYALHNSFFLNLWSTQSTLSTPLIC